MAYLLLGVLMAIISFFIKLSVPFDVCVRWPNYGVRYRNESYCFVDLTTNLQFGPFLFKEAVDFCKFSGGIVDISFRDGSHRALLNMLLLSDVGKLTGVNEKMRRFTRGFTLPDHDCSQSYTIKPGCAVVCAFKSCPPGTFGYPECQSTCGCKDVSRCDIATGSCSEIECAPGFFGPPACRKCNCNMNTGCDNETGECPLGCKKGWRGKSCQQRKCRGGKCPALARFSRETTCQVGWTGDDCKARQCPEGFYGLPDCNKTCSCQKSELCSPIDGVCGGNSCVGGGSGPQCSDPSNNLTCPPFSYGSPRCDFFCFCYNNTPCDATTGICPGICIPGWTGYHCDQRLCGPSFYFYPSCDRPCECLVAESCNALTGICELENCNLWGNCTGPQAVEAEGEQLSIFWYLIIAIVVFVLGTVALLAVLFVQRHSPENESREEI